MRTGENIRKRKNGRWEARIYDIHTKKYHSIYAKTYQEVKERKNEYIKSKEQPLTTSPDTIETCFEIWLDDIKPLVKQSTYAKYHDIAHNHIINHLGAIKLNNLKQEDINYFIQQKIKDGLSSKTIQDIICVFKQGIKPHNMPFTYKLPKATNKEIKLLQEDEYKSLVHYLLIDTTITKAGVLLALLCGLRIGELCALTWQDIDLKNGVLHITKTLQRIKNTDLKADKKTQIVIDTPKSIKSLRTIPLQQLLIEKLEPLQQKEETYFLTGTYKYIEPRAYQKKYEVILKNCHIEYINFHALRHTFATKSMECNVDIKSLSEILGHYDVKFTMSQYVHSSFEHKKSQLEKLTQNF